jgi:16S rRNA (adenine1518-N6/adenine1519-N6)-dimethyltransferase
MDKRGTHFSFVPKKRLGQNFLIDSQLLKKIVFHAEILPTEIVLEIGPGFGTLTQIIQEKAQRVITIEKDPVLAEFLQEKFKTNPKVEIILGDVLDQPLPEYDKVVATPPYNISSKLLFQLIKKNYRAIVLTFQKEFADRLVSKPGTKNYGRLTVMINHKTKPELLENIPKKAFRPQPKVDSAIVKIIPKEYNKTVDEKLFSELVLGLFTQRRRKVRSSLKHYIDKKIPYFPIEILNTEIPDKRVYQMTVEDFEQLTQKISSKLKFYNKS